MSASGVPVGLRIGERPSDLSPELVASLGDLDTVFLSDAMSRFNSLAPELRPVGDGMRVVGRALTVRPSFGDNLAVYMAIDMARPGDVVVIESRRLDRVAQWGDLTSAVARRVGVAGAIMDGAVRDKQGIISVGLPVFALPQPVPTGGTRVGPGEILVPVAVGGVAISPGDVIVGDDNGVVAIPATSAEQVLVSAQSLASADSEKMRSARTDPESLAWVRSARRRAGYDA